MSNGPLLKRRELFAAGGALAAAGALPLAPAAAANSSPAILMFDPAIARARELARAERGTGTRLVAIEGDRVRFWRALGVQRGQPIAGFTSWSDFVILPGLAAEQGLRLRREISLPQPSGPALIGWVLA